MTVSSTINALKKGRDSSLKKGYKDTALEYSFQIEVLDLLKRINKSIKEDSKQKKYLWQTLEDIKSADKTGGANER